MKSKFFITTDELEQAYHYYNLKIKLKLCLKIAGFKKIRFNFNVPNDIFANQQLIKMSIGETKIFTDIPSTKTPGMMLIIQLLRLENKSIKLLNNKRVTSQVFQITWNNNEYQPITFNIVEHEELSFLIKSTVNIYPWAQINITEDKPFIGELIINGNITEIIRMRDE